MTVPVQRPARRTYILGFSLALAAAISYGVSQVVAKFIVTEYAEPQVAALSGIFFGMIGLFFVGVRDLPKDLRSPRQARMFIALAGVFSSLGVLFLFLALDRAPVVVVAPVAATNPLLAIVFSIFFLRTLERVTLRIVIGALLVVGGVALVVLGRAS